MLKTIKKTILEVNYSHLETYIEEVYGIKEFSFVADQEMSNDSEKSFLVDKVEPLNEWDQKNLDEFVNSKGKIGTFMTDTLLQDLLNHSLIEPGEYLISVCW